MFAPNYLLTEQHFLIGYSVSVIRYRLCPSCVFYNSHYLFGHIILCFFRNLYLFQRDPFLTPFFTSDPEAAVLVPIWPSWGLCHNSHSSVKLSSHQMWFYVAQEFHLNTHVSSLTSTLMAVYWCWYGVSQQDKVIWPYSSCDLTQMPNPII